MVFEDYTPGIPAQNSTDERLDIIIAQNKRTIQLLEQFSFTHDGFVRST